MSRVAVAVKMDDLVKHDSLIVSIGGQGGREGVEGGRGRSATTHRKRTVDRVERPHDGKDERVIA